MVKDNHDDGCWVWYLAVKKGGVGRCRSRPPSMILLLPTHTYIFHVARRYQVHFPPRSSTLTICPLSLLRTNHYKVIHTSVWDFCFTFTVRGVLIRKAYLGMPEKRNFHTREKRFEEDSLMVAHPNGCNAVVGSNPMSDQKLKEFFFHMISSGAPPQNGTQFEFLWACGISVSRSLFAVF